MTLGTAAAPAGSPPPPSGHRPGAVAVPTSRRGRRGRRVLVPALPVAALAALVVAQLLAPGALAASAPALAVGGLLLGLPHGAVDHMVPFWVTGAPVTRRRLAQVLLSYLVVAAAAGSALLLAPGPAVAVFLVVSALHFGRGEAAFSAERTGRPVPRLRDDAALALAHGAVVVGLPYALWHTTSGPVLAQLAPGVLADPPRLLLRLVVAATAALVVLAGGRLLAQHRWRDAVELAALTACFTIVPPLAAFGVYFGLWHAGRHTARMLSLAALAAPAGAGAHWALRRYLVHAAAPTAVALGALLAIAATHDASVLAIEIAVLLALTFPHVQTVFVLDARASRAAAR